MYYPKVAIVILNWNGLNFLQQFLPSVLASTYPNLDIILGDNASSDASVTFVQVHYPQVSILRNQQNAGFAKGYNQILSRVLADYFMLLSSDVSVTPGWLEPLIQAMESDPLIAVAMPKMKSWHNKNYFEYAGAAGGFIDALGYTFCRGRIFHEVEVDRGQYNQSGEIFWASGAALCIKKRYWDLSGGFDENFFAHMEEVDLCWRLKNQGLKILYCAASEVYHVGSGTIKESAFRTYLKFRNNLLLLKKNLLWRQAMWIIPTRLFLDSIIAVLYFVYKKRYHDACAIGKAHKSFINALIGKTGKSIKSTVSSNLVGRYQGSIVWDFFIKKNKHFSDLVTNKKDI